MPLKLNQDRRQHVPWQQHKVTNWPAYDASLRERSNLTVWFTDETIAAWIAEPRTTRGGQPWYAPLAILTALTLRMVFCLTYWQVGGLLGSVIGLLGLSLRVPNRITLTRRAATPDVPRPHRPSIGADSELLRLGVNAGTSIGTGQIVISTLTFKKVDDSTEVGPLPDQITAR